MTVKETYYKLLNDPEFMTQAIVENNFPAVVKKLEQAGFTDIDTYEAAEAIIFNMASNGRIDDVSAILNVPYIEGQNSLLDGAFQLIKDQNELQTASQYKTGSWDLSDDSDAFDYGNGSTGGSEKVISAGLIASLAGAVGNIVGNIFNKGDKPTVSATLIAAQQAQAQAEADRRRKNTMLIVGSVLAFGVLALIMYKMFRS